MDKELKAKWVAALRSGKYKQSFGMLRRKEGYCCLGVLCEVVGAEIQEKDGAIAIYKGNSTKDGNGYLPPMLAAELGLSQSHENMLVWMNDAGKRSFAEIADHIQATL